MNDNVNIFCHVLKIDFQLFLSGTTFVSLELHEPHSFLSIRKQLQCGSHIINGMQNPLAFHQNYSRYDGPSESGSFFTYENGQLDLSRL